MLVAVVAAAGCEMEPERVCQDAVTPAVTVVVRDSVANTPIAQDVELVGILRDGSYTESMWRWRSELSGGDDRPGNYEVEIRAEGYQTWTRSGIVVEPGAVCPIDYPAELTARLVPETGLPVLSVQPTASSSRTSPKPPRSASFAGRKSAPVLSERTRVREPVPCRPARTLIPSEPGHSPLAYRPDIVLVAFAIARRSHSIGRM